MGGAAGGSLASSTAANAFSEYVLENIQTYKDDICTLLSDALASANGCVYEKAQADRELSGMGTTICAVLALGEKLYCLSVGDSRIYLLKNGRMTRLSHDHSYVQTLVDAGQITEEEARNHPNRNIITKAVGTENSVDGDVFVLDETCADKILICSDGLCGYVDDVKTEEIINNCRNCEEAVNALVDKANEAGGFDNITAVIMENANSSKNS
jgi:protein phosphatase